MSFATVGLVITAGTAVYSAYNSVRKNAKADLLAKSNIRPVFTADGKIQQMYDLAASESQSTYIQDYATKQLEQGQMTGIDAVLKSGGTLDFETANNLYGKQMSAALDKIQMDRDRKIANVNNAAYNSAASHDAEFSYNKDAPFKDKAQQEALLKQEAAASAKDAQNAIISGASNYGIAKTEAGRVAADARTNSWAAKPQLSAWQASNPLPTSQTLRAPAQGIGAGPKRTDVGLQLVGYDDFGSEIWG